ncbi:MAG: hypothetical protein ABI353_17475, partial [Isosphaeraceae bacterium]
MRGPKTVGDLLHAYRSSSLTRDKGGRTWETIKAAIAEAMDRERLQAAYHSPSQTLFRRTEDGLDLSRCVDASALELTGEIARDLEGDYRAMMDEVEPELWVRVDRAEAVGRAGGRPVYLTQADGQQVVLYANAGDYASGALRVRQVDLPPRVLRQLPEAIAFQAVGSGDSSGSAPIYLVRPEQVLPGPPEL